MTLIATKNDGPGLLGVQLGHPKHSMLVRAGGHFVFSAALIILGLNLLAWDWGWALIGVTPSPGGMPILTPWRIWTLDLTTGESGPFIETEGEREYGPSWSPDGRQFVFCRGVRIWLADGLGSSPRPLESEQGKTYFAGSPQAIWSPDGTVLLMDGILASLGRDGLSDGYTFVDPETGETRLLESPPGMSFATAPSWQAQSSEYEAIMSAPKYELARGTAAGREWSLQAFEDPTDAVAGAGPAAGLAWRGFRLLAPPAEGRALGFTTHSSEGRSVLVAGFVTEAVASLRFVATDGTAIDVPIHRFPETFETAGLAGAYVLNVDGKTGVLEALDDQGQRIDSSAI